jgi:hypothetical protein
MVGEEGKYRATGIGGFPHNCHAKEDADGFPGGDRSQEVGGGGVHRC